MAYKEQGTPLFWFCFIMLGVPVKCKTVTRSNRVLIENVPVLYVTYVIVCMQQSVRFAIIYYF